jgi:hypothetical protein
MVLHTVPGWSRTHQSLHKNPAPKFLQSLQHKILNRLMDKFKVIIMPSQNFINLGILHIPSLNSEFYISNDTTATYRNALPTI